ncbi:hypothetical protein [Chitinophaga oryziterrae]|nr:hypothetical protein [Chitinophaga oryziterrae]
MSKISAAPCGPRILPLQYFSTRIIASRSASARESKGGGEVSDALIC